MIAVSDYVYGGAIVGLVVIVWLVLTMGRSITAKVGAIAVTVDSVNRAVNTRPVGQPTISEQVATTAARVDDIHVAVETLALATNRLAAHDVSMSTQVAALALRITALELAHP